MNQDARFFMIGGNSIFEIVVEMNERADQLGRLIYLGRNFMMEPQANQVVIPKEVPFIAVFDNMAVLVETIEDQLSFKPETLESLKLKTVISG